MSDTVIRFAKATIRRMSGEVSEDLKYSYLPENLPSPLPEDLVQQHVELLFALSVKDSSLLEE